MRIPVLQCLFILSTLGVQAQGTLADYKRAYSLKSKFTPDKVYYWPQNLTWVDSCHLFHYAINTPQGRQYVLFDADNNTRSIFKSQKELQDALPTTQRKPKTTRHPGSLPATPFRHPQRHWMEVDEETEQQLQTSPDGKWDAWIEGHNLVVHRVGHPYAEKQQLTQDGTIGNYYSNRILWSPDSRRIFVCKRQATPKRYAYYVESSPSDQLQPILHQQEYAKPGDQLPQLTPHIFTLTISQADTTSAASHWTHVVGNVAQDQYELSAFRWMPDSRIVTMEYNQRGHKIYQLLSMNADNGQVVTCIEEHSDKFVNYYRIWRHWLSDGRLLWTSERDNWNHIYLYSGEKQKARSKKSAHAPSRNTGSIGDTSLFTSRFSPSAITQGSWCVREVLHVDENAQLIYFTASGYHPEEDPYNIHYFRIRIDGTQLQELTPGNGNHQVQFSYDRKFLVDTYSSPNQPPQTILRTINISDDSPTGSTPNSGSHSSCQLPAALQLETADISPLQEQGWCPPEVFVAPGRDQTTPIWGIIQRPTNFDPNKQYPVIEYIYAGPGDAYTPKSFQPYYYNLTPLAELGFIVVQMDGMGTSWRGKKFEEVCYKNLKDAGLPDRMAWIRAAAEKYPYIDTLKVGIFGASAGGQESTAAVLHHPNFYRAAYSACGCHDNRIDKIWWNEQWMGYPVDSAYIQSSNVYHAHKLQRPLMLVVGELDDNVDPASTMQLANALIKAGKDFELVVIPGAHHTMGENYGEHKRFDFFVRHLMGVEPPKWDLLQTEP